MFEQLNEAVLSVINKIEHSGNLAYISGVTVRELVMGEKPISYVIVTNATYSTIKNLFKRVVEVAHKNSVTVIENKTAFEIYYNEDNSEDTLAEDKIFKILQSFDFTINSIAYHPDRGILDSFGGMDDINSKNIKFTNPLQSEIAKKPLRMLRALRYSAQLGFTIDEKTKADIKKCALLIKRVSNDRIREELDKILISENPGVFKQMNELGLLKYIMPELDVCFSVQQKNKYHIYNVGEHITQAVINTPNDIVVRWAALLHDIGKPLCKSTDSNGIIHFYGHHRESVRLGVDILRRYKFEYQTSKEIINLVENHDVRIDQTPQGVKKMMTRTGQLGFLKLLTLQEADNKAKNLKFFPDKLNKLNDVRRIYQKVVAERHPYRISDLAVNGRDLNKLGLKPGHEIGEMLQKLLDEVLIDPGLNTREYLIQRAKQIRKRKQ